MRKRWMAMALLLLPALALRGGGQSNEQSPAGVSAGSRRTAGPAAGAPKVRKVGAVPATADARSRLRTTSPAVAELDYKSAYNYELSRLLPLTDPPVAMKLEQVGATVINPSNNYSEDTTIRITAVDSCGATQTNFTGTVNIAEDGTSIYSQNGGALPSSVNITSGGTATFVARSLAGPKTELQTKPDDAKIKTTNYPVYGGTNLSVVQWIISGAQIDPQASGQVFDWFQSRVKDIRASATGSAATVLAALGSYTVSNSLSSGGGCQTQITRAPQSPIVCNPYQVAYRLDGGWWTDTVCGTTRVKFLTNAIYHEGRHAYQGSLAALSGNDADGDFLPQNVPIAPTTAIVDSTAPRMVCNPNASQGNQISTCAYHGNSTFDSYQSPDFAWYAIEMDAYIFAMGL